MQTTVLHLADAGTDCKIETSETGMQTFAEKQPSRELELVSIASLAIVKSDNVDKFFISSDRSKPCPHCTKNNKKSKSGSNGNGRDEVREQFGEGRD